MATRRKQNGLSLVGTLDEIFGEDLDLEEPDKSKRENTGRFFYPDEEFTGSHASKPIYVRQFMVDLKELSSKIVQPCKPPPRLRIEIPAPASLRATPKTTFSIITVNNDGEATAVDVGTSSDLKRQDGTGITAEFFGGGVSLVVPRNVYFQGEAATETEILYHKDDKSKSIHSMSTRRQRMKVHPVFRYGDCIDPLKLPRKPKECNTIKNWETSDSEVIFTESGADETATLCSNIDSEEEGDFYRAIDDIRTEKRRRFRREKEMGKSNQIESEPWYQQYRAGGFRRNPRAKIPLAWYGSDEVKADVKLEVKADVKHETLEEMRYRAFQKRVKHKRPVGRPNKGYKRRYKEPVEKPKKISRAQFYSKYMGPKSSNSNVTYYGVPNPNLAINQVHALSKTQRKEKGSLPSEEKKRKLDSKSCQSKPNSETDLIDSSADESDLQEIPKNTGANKSLAKKTPPNGSAEKCSSEKMPRNKSIKKPTTKKVCNRPSSIKPSEKSGKESMSCKNYLKKAGLDVFSRIGLGLENEMSTLLNVGVNNSKPKRKIQKSQKRASSPTKSVTSVISDSDSMDWFSTVMQGVQEYDKLVGQDEDNTSESSKSERKGKKEAELKSLGEQIFGSDDGDDDDDSGKDDSQSVVMEDGIMSLMTSEDEETSDADSEKVQEMLGETIWTHDLLSDFEDSDGEGEDGSCNINTTADEPSDTLPNPVNPCATVKNQISDFQFLIPATPRKKDPDFAAIFRDIICQLDVLSDLESEDGSDSDDEGKSGPSLSPSPSVAEQTECSQIVKPWSVIDIFSENSELPNLPDPTTEQLRLQEFREAVESSEVSKSHELTKSLESTDSPKLATSSELAISSELVSSPELARSPEFLGLVESRSTGMPSMPEFKETDIPKSHELKNATELPILPELSSSPESPKSPDSPNEILTGVSDTDNPGSNASEEVYSPYPDISIAKVTSSMYDDQSEPSPTDYIPDFDCDFDSNPEIQPNIASIPETDFSLMDLLDSVDGDSQSSFCTGNQFSSSQTHSEFPNVVGTDFTALIEKTGFCDGTLTQSQVEVEPATVIVEENGSQVPIIENQDRRVALVGVNYDIPPQIRGFVYTLRKKVVEMKLRGSYGLADRSEDPTHWSCPIVPDEVEDSYNSRCKKSWNYRMAGTVRAATGLPNSKLDKILDAFDPTLGRHPDDVLLLNPLFNNGAARLGIGRIPMELVHPEKSETLSFLARSIGPKAKITTSNHLKVIHTKKNKIDPVSVAHRIEIKRNLDRRRTSFVKAGDLIVKVTFYNAHSQRHIVTDSIKSIPYYKRSKLTKRVFTMEVFGRMRLSALRKRFVCIQDCISAVETEYPTETCLPKREAAFRRNARWILRVDETLVVDARIKGSVDAARRIIKHYMENPDVAFTCPKNIIDASKARIVDLKIRFGYPYTYIHQDGCEHVVVFNQARVYPARIPGGLPESFPKYTVVSRLKSKKCKLDNKNLARYVVTNCKLLPEDPMYLCADCAQLFVFSLKRVDDGEGKQKVVPYKVDPDCRVHQFSQLVTNSPYHLVRMPVTKETPKKRGRPKVVPKTKIKRLQAKERFYVQQPTTKKKG